MGIRKKSI